MEWAPGAKSLSIFGDFNNWDRDQYICEKNSFGQFNITIKAVNGESVIKHGYQYKIQIEAPDGTKHDKNSAWARYSVQDPKTTLFNGVFWDPETEYEWKFPKPRLTDV